MVLPTSSETATAGVSEIFAGVGKGALVVGLLLLQPVRAAIKIEVRPMDMNLTTANDLPMHPPRPVEKRGELFLRFRKTPSVEAGNPDCRIFRIAGFSTSRESKIRRFENPGTANSGAKAALPL